VITATGKCGCEDVRVIVDTSPPARGPQPVAAFFAHGVAAADPASVAMHIRAAIELGILTDGQVLPRESRFAEQLGVTVFTLREALARLRDEGLVVTRVGRGGGSFVHRVADTTDDAARAQLLGMSSVEVRDLGDWRSTLAEACAEFASARASANNLARLAILADRVAGDDLADARRAAARFRIELADAAQSLRLSGAHIRLQEEHGALFSLPLARENVRHRLGDAMRRILAALRDRDADAARRAAAAESSVVLDALLRERYALLAPRSSGPVDDPLTALQQASDGVIIDAVEGVRRLSANVPSALNALLRKEGQDAALAELRAAAAREVDLAGPAVGGMGVMFEPGVFPDHPYGGAWVTRAGEMTHPADPERDDFYDYSMAEWLVEPRSTGMGAITGPFVDSRGANEYILTVAEPLAVGGRFLGVAAADIPLAEVESAVASLLGAAGRACVIATAEGRVVVSNTAAHPPGELIGELRGERRTSPRTGWTTVVLADG
jgi:DNA-binding FadR family transcriptional regulator